MSQGKMHIAILTGGPSAERGIAMASAAFVGQNLDPNRFICRTIVIEPHGWIDQVSGRAIDLNNFTLAIDSDPIQFDFVFLIIHGTPAEDGKLQGYFESRGIPHSTCDTLTSALTFNKQWCKNFLKCFDIPMAWSRVVPASEIGAVDVSEFKYPVFVKPNNNGSSYGVSKVNTAERMLAALKKAAQFDHEILVETFLAGREFSCGAVRDGSQVHVFPITEIIPKNEFFDYQAKYEGASQEVTPADLSDTLATQCQQRSEYLYRVLNCRGLVRFDYILQDNTFYLLEANTIPGLSPASIVPQQARAYGWTMPQMLSVVVDDCSRKVS
jgi:D-alanine-D-alanine ligase